MYEQSGFRELVLPGVLAICRLLELSDHIGDLLVCPSGVVDLWQPRSKQDGRMNQHLQCRPKHMFLLCFYLLLLFLLEDAIVIGAMANTWTLALVLRRSVGVSLFLRLIFDLYWLLLCLLFSSAIASAITKARTAKLFNPTWHLTEHKNESRMQEMDNLRPSSDTYSRYWPHWWYSFVRCFAKRWPSTRVTESCHCPWAIPINSFGHSAGLWWSDQTYWKVREAFEPILRAVPTPFQVPCSSLKSGRGRVYWETWAWPRLSWRQHGHSSWQDRSRSSSKQNMAAIKGQSNCSVQGLNEELTRYHAH